MDKLLCPGFLTSSCTAGLKKHGVPDLGIIYSTVPATAAGVFTKNLVKAAPVILDMKRLKSGKAQAIIVNSGNANCCTAKQGMVDALEMTKHAASSLNIDKELVLVASTGVIGLPLAIDKIKKAVPGLVKNLSNESFTDLAKAIMTTDKFHKTVSEQQNINGKPFTITAIAKGAGMICPDMATMLCFICTDIKASPDFLKKSLLHANDRSFNTITVDGDTSTNDSVIIMANGVSGICMDNNKSAKLFQKTLDDVLIKLAKMIVRDGEGATKLVKINICNANSDKDAKKIANTIANSNLVKTAFFGEDANWGRIIAATGRSKALMDPDKVKIFFDDILIVENGAGCGESSELKANKVLKLPEFTITVDIGIGTGKATVLTCDLTLEYIKINADYRT